MVDFSEMYCKCVSIEIAFQYVKRNPEEILQKNWENLSWFGETEKPDMKLKVVLQREEKKGVIRVQWITKELEWSKRKWYECNRRLFPFV